MAVVFDPILGELENERVSPEYGYELDELHNVKIENPQPGQSLQYDGSVWRNVMVGAAAVTAVFGAVTYVDEPARPVDAQFVTFSQPILFGSVVYVDEPARPVDALIVTVSQPIGDYFVS